MSRTRRLLPMVLLLLAAGCGRGKKQITAHPVSGRVMYGGKPAAGVQVYLFPTSAPMRPDIPANPHGVTGADGKFTLTTFTDGDGAPEGGYQVILLWPPESSEEEEATVDQLQGWYDAVHSKLTARIKPGANELPTFNVPVVTGPPDAVAGIPGRN